MTDTAQDAAIKLAIEAIGKHAQDDHKLLPSQHSANLETAAPALAALLADSQMNVLAQQYERHDGEAGEEQALYKSTMTRANLAVLMATVFGALMMAGQIGGSSLPVLQNLVVIFGILAGFAATAGSMWLFRAREGSLLENWMTSRAKAETNRNNYFTALADMPGDAALALLKLEYFRRYQLDVQCNYFRKRAAEYRKSAEKTLRLGGYAVAMSSLAGVGGGVLGLANNAWTSLGALSVIGGALGAYAGSYESMNQGRRNAQRYDATLEALEIMMSRLGETRKAIADGKVDALKAFVAAVNEQLGIEHRQWMEVGAGAKSVVSSLDAKLTAVIKGEIIKAK